MKRSGRTFVCALTAPGQGGISVILLCGPDAHNILPQVFYPAAKMRFSRRKNSQFFYGHITEGGEVVDEVILFPLSKYFSPFGEDAFEINCHGGVAVTDAIIDALCRSGARRIDFSEVLRRLADSGQISAIGFEVRVELARATSPLAVRMLLSQLRGALEREIERIQTLLPGKVDDAMRRISRLLRYAPLGIFLCEPPLVFISGSPNVGKSTLFNKLCSSERVIVHEIPGTTRDVITETILIDGLAVRLSDSAGIGAVSSELEKLAERFARKALKTADFILFVLDSSRKLNSFEKRFLPALDREKSILIINKTDLPKALRESELPESMRTVQTSALKEIGIEGVKAAMLSRIVGRKFPTFDRAMIFTRRQKRLFEAALQDLENGNIGGANRSLLEIVRGSVLHLTSVTPICRKGR
jgi:tRNA modification GTPase